MTQTTSASTQAPTSVSPTEVGVARPAIILDSVSKVFGHAGDAVHAHDEQASGGAHHDEMIQGQRRARREVEGAAEIDDRRHLPVDVDDPFHQRGRSGQRHHRHRADDLGHRGQGDRVAPVRQLEDEGLQRAGGRGVR